MRSAYAGGHGCWGVGHPGFALDEDVTGSVIESHARDSDWIAREMGDVPVRSAPLGGIDYRPAEAITPMTHEQVMASACLLWGIPAESLGRDQ